MRRALLSLALCLSIIAAMPPASADPLSDARRQARALRADLQAATLKLDAAEVALYKTEQQLAFSQRQVQTARSRLVTARGAMAGEVAAMYRSGGLAMADAILQPNPEQLLGRIELAGILVSRQAQTINDAQVAGEAYTAALGRVAVMQHRAEAMRDQASRAVHDLTARLRQAQAVQARLTRLQARPIPPRPTRATADPSAARVASGSPAGGIACLMEAPYSYTDTFGAPRSGGRTHQGTDVMAPYGAEVYAYTDGVISRETTNAYGGITLYLQGASGVEYYYAHLARYAVPAGTRVSAGQLIAYNGQSGNASATAPHVHFEVHPGGPGSTPVNPYPYVRRACG
jgi:murein DD-endopeptidase MepM/ murein hydrolase activator NlpD